MQAGQLAEVDGGLRLARADEDAAVAGAQGVDVAGHDEVRGSGGGSPSTWIAFARSAAEMPVVTPWRASTETVKAVPNWAWFWWWPTIIGMRSASSRSPVVGAQMTPLVCWSMKAMDSA